MYFYLKFLNLIMNKLIYYQFQMYCNKNFRFILNSHKINQKRISTQTYFNMIECCNYNLIDFLNYTKNN